MNFKLVSCNWCYESIYTTETGKHYKALPNLPTTPNRELVVKYLLAQYWSYMFLCDTSGLHCHMCHSRRQFGRRWISWAGGNSRARNKQELMFPQLPEIRSRLRLWREEVKQVIKAFCSNMSRTLLNLLNSAVRCGWEKLNLHRLQEEQFRICFIPKSWFLMSPL